MNAIDYDVISFRAVYKDGIEVERADRWGIDDVGIERDWAIASMVMRAIRHVEWLGELMIRDILAGKLNPETPHLINCEETGVYVWFRIIESDQPHPPLPVSDSPSLTSA